MEHLVDEETGIIRLFTPAFSRAPHDPGYIKGYPPGVRENGGQYTHAATWVVLALAKQGRAQEAWNCFKLLNPVNHALDAASSETYRVEPYVVTRMFMARAPMRAVAVGVGIRVRPVGSIAQQSRVFSALPAPTVTCMSRRLCQPTGTVSR